MSGSLVWRLKKAAGLPIFPIWCGHCGGRLSEIEIGFQDTGSYFSCENRACVAHRMLICLSADVRRASLMQIMPLPEREAGEPAPEDVSTAPAAPEPVGAGAAQA